MNYETLSMGEECVDSTMPWETIIRLATGSRTLTIIP